MKTSNKFGAADDIKVSEKTGNQRVAYGEALLELGVDDSRIVVCEADLGKSTMTYAFSQAYPERYFEMGIAEANMTSFAAGLSLTGKIPFTNSFAVFAGGRAYDQIRQGIAIGQLNVKIVGSSAGLSDFGDGATHQSVEDIAIMRAIPNMVVLVPADASEVKRMVHWMVNYDGPVYLRVSRNDLPEISRGEGLELSVLRQGKDVTILAAGVMVYRAIQAAECLESYGVSVRVVNAPKLKPLSYSEILEVCEGTRAIVTAEEHSEIGGLASIVAMALRGDSRVQKSVCIADVFGQSAENVEDLMRFYRLTAGDIAETVMSAL